MLDALVFCPQAPALVPEVGRGLEPELAEVRASCRSAIARAAALTQRVVALAGAPSTRRYASGSHGSFTRYGAPLVVTLGSDEPGPIALPDALCVGAWLLRDTLGAECGATAWAVGPDGLTDAAGEDLLGPVSTTLLVLGDGSARRTEKAPGYLDERAGLHDAATAAALGSGDPSRLHARADDADLLVAGSAAWDAAATLAAPSRWRAELLQDVAPFGVGYFVALWQRRTEPG